MYIQHEDYLINLNQIKYIKTNDKVLKIHIYFESKSGTSDITFNFDDINSFDEFINKILNK